VQELDLHVLSHSPRSLSDCLDLLGISADGDADDKHGSGAKGAGKARSPGGRGEGGAGAGGAGGAGAPMRGSDEGTER
jgi:hypothetical protein